MLGQALSEKSIEDTYSCAKLLAAREKKLSSLKVQIAGPTTLEKYSKKTFDINLYQENCQNLFEYFDLLCDDLFVFIDEPLLCTENTTFIKTLDRINSHGVVSGVHCCGENISWKRLLDLPISVISFDTHLDHIIPKRELNNFFKKGGIAILGIDKNRVMNQVIISQFKQYSEEKIYLSTSCGLSERSEEECLESNTFLGSFELI